MTTATERPAQEEPPDDDELDSAAAARKIAGYLIIAGCVIAVACIGFIVWEQWRANQAALESDRDPASATLYPMGNGKVHRPPPDPGPQDGASDPESPQADQPEQVEGN